LSETKSNRTDGVIRNGRSLISALSRLSLPKLDPAWVMHSPYCSALSNVERSITRTSDSWLRGSERGPRSNGDRHGIDRGSASARPADRAEAVSLLAPFDSVNWHHNLRSKGRCEGTQIDWGGVLKKKRLDLTDWEKTRRRSNALALGCGGRKNRERLGASDLAFRKRRRCRPKPTGCPRHRGSAGACCQEGAGRRSKGPLQQLNVIVT
jgi:hypothetical protein